MSLFISFFVVPIAAEAQTVPTRPSKDYPFCFSITKTEPVIDPATGLSTGDTTERLDSSCYPDLAACTNGQRAATDVTVPCHDAYATMSKYEKTVQEKGVVTALGGKAVEVVVGCGSEHVISIQCRQGQCCWW